MRPPWSKEEDDQLRSIVQRYGAKNWPLISESFPGRSAACCSRRWLNHLSLDCAFTQEEEEMIIRYKARGYNWSTISHHILNGSRTNTEIKNYWERTLKRKCRDEQEQPLKRMASSDGGIVSTRLCLSLGSSLESSGGDSLTCLSLSLPSQVNESAQLDLNIAIDNCDGDLTELIPVKEIKEEEEEKPKGYRDD